MADDLVPVFDPESLKKLFASDELHFKIVYDGPGLSGKSANLEYIQRHTNPANCTKLVTVEDVLFVDFPIAIPKQPRARFHLYTAAGSTVANETRKSLLKGLSGVVFVADSRPECMNANIEALAQLRSNLKALGKDLESIPFVIQYNKRDAENALPVEALRQQLNAPTAAKPQGAPELEATATAGTNVFNTLKTISGLVLANARAAAAEAPARPSLPASEEVRRVVFYGAGLVGKRSILQLIHNSTPADQKSDIVSVQSEDERSFSYDLQRPDFPEINGKRLRLRLSTLSDETHRTGGSWFWLMQKGVDAVVFVADAQIEQLEANAEFFEDLPYRIPRSLMEVPRVLCITKRDMENVASPEEVQSFFPVPFVAVSVNGQTGEGVPELLERLVHEIKQAHS